MILKNNIILWIFLMACLSNCQNSDKQTSGTITSPIEDAPQSTLVDLKISPLVFRCMATNFTVLNQASFFSPFERNEVWLCPENGEALELDLNCWQIQSCSRINANARFFKNFLRASNIFPDVIDSRVCSVSELSTGYLPGLINPVVMFKSFNITTGKPVTTISFSTNYAWVGTTPGIMVL